jgi:hypothetical protein
VKQASSPVLLDEAHARLLQQAVSVSVSARDARNVPTLSRTLGCRVAADRRRVTVFVSASRAAALLRDLKDNGRIAVVFSRPSTHETIQLKGRDAEIGACTEEDLRLLSAARQAFVEELVGIGYSEAYARAVASAAPADMVPISFTPSAAYLQTPGPDAGRPLGS